MKWLNMKFILYTFLGLLCVTSGLFRNHTNGNNEPSMSVANTNVIVEKYSEMLNGDLQQDCGVKKSRKGKLLSTKDKIKIQEKERADIISKIKALFISVKSNLEEIDKLLGSISEQVRDCKVIEIATFNNIVDYRNLLTSIIRRLNICGSNTITNMSDNPKKPDYGYVFTNDIETGKGAEIYAEIKKEPSQSIVFSKILGLIDKTIKLLYEIPSMCSGRWRIEKRLECLLDYEWKHVYPFQDGLDKQWFRYEDAENNHDEEKVVEVIVNDNTRKDTKMIERAE